MARPIVLSNNQILVGLDDFGLVREFYFPFVGLDNLISQRRCHHKIGVFVDNQFSWVNNHDWQICLDYLDDCLVSNITMVNEKLDLKLIFHDFVDPDFNNFVRIVDIKNLGSQHRSISIFFHQVFILSNEGRGDTVMYVPNGNYIYNYRGSTSLLISGKFDDGTSFDQFACGNYHIEGKVGTYVDAEDGYLSNNPVEHASVDSTIRFSTTLDAKESKRLNYWLIANSSKDKVEKLHYEYLHSAIVDRLEYTKNYWKNWLNQSKIDQSKHKKDILKSLLIIKAHCDKDGSIIASSDSSILNYGRDYYAYCWPRDSYFALIVLLKLGFNQEAKNFINFCLETISPTGYMMHKYLADKSVGSTWHPLIYNGIPNLAIQEDETAVIPIIVGQYFNQNQDNQFLNLCFEKLIVPTANFMTNYINHQTNLPHPSYDLWEEKFLISTYTTSCVISGLKSSIDLAMKLGDNNYHYWEEAYNQLKNNFNQFFDEDQGYFIKGFGLDDNNHMISDKTIDISNLMGPMIFDVLPADDPTMLSTLKVIEDNLKNQSPSGGVIRYANDNYFLRDQNYKGNPWVITTLWLAKYYLVLNRPKEANELIEWVKELQKPSGVLCEQYDAVTKQEVSVNPLVWSQSTFIDVIQSL